jgi:hypothetical protein
MPMIKKVSCTVGAFHVVRPATLHFVRHHHRQFDCNSAAGTAAGSTDPIGSDATAIRAQFHGLSRELRYAGNELPECLRHYRTDDDRQSRGQCILRAELQHPGACLQAGLQ